MDKALVFANIRGLCCPQEAAKQFEKGKNSKYLQLALAIVVVGLTEIYSTGIPSLAAATVRI